MIYIIQNIWPILAATLAAFVFGGLYYRIVRAPWLRATGPNARTAETRPGALHYLGVFIAEFWMAAILAGAVILAPTDQGAGPWTMALGSAFIIWVGFVLPALFVSYGVAGLSRALFAFDAAHWLFAMVLMAAVIRIVGVTSPA